MPEHDRSAHGPSDRFYLVSIIGYALVATGFIGYFVWRMLA